MADHALSEFQMLFNLLRRFIQHFFNRFQLQSDSDKPLRKSVVNLASHAIALGEHSRKLRLHSPDAETVKRPPHKGCRHSQQNVKPVGLIEMRLQVKIKR